MISAIDENGRSRDLGCVKDALKVISGVSAIPEVLVTAQDLTASYANLGSAINMDGFSTLGIKLSADTNASEDGFIQVLGMMTASDTPFEIDALSVETLWTGTATPDFTKYYEFETGVLPFVIVQGKTSIVNAVAAYLTGGTGAQGTFGTWAAITDASFQIPIDGVTYNIDGVDFTGAGDMDAVAAILQAAIRVATGKTETVVWSTNKFVVTSSISTDTSAVGVTATSTGTVGTDISGAGAAAWMDAETGRGTATAVVLAADLTLTIVKG